MTTTGLAPQNTTTQNAMATYAEVVVPVDFSPLSWRVLRLATSMAKAFNARRRVLHVDTSSPWLDEDSSSLVLKAAPQGRSVSVEVCAARQPVDGIVRVLTDDGPSLLVMSTHGHTAATELATGSTVEEVLRHWSGPLLAAGPCFARDWPGLSRIVLCADPDAATLEPLVADVRGWALRFGVPVEVVTVTDDASAMAFERVCDEQHRLNALVEQLATDGVVVDAVRLQAKNVARELAEFVEDAPGTVVAMATRARPASARLLLGSVTTGVLRRSKAPLLLRQRDRVRG